MNATIFLVVLSFLALIIFWANFRRWLGRQLDALWVILQREAPNLAAMLVDIYHRIRRVVGVYLFIIIVVTLLAGVLIALALLINVPGVTAFAFVFSLALVLLVWFPAGALLRIFGITKTVVPKFLKTIIAWIAFLGFIGLVFPDLISFKTMLGVALVGFMALGLTARINVLDRVVFPLVMVMILTVTWKYFFPEDFRSSVRYAQSWSKKINTKKDRGSLNNETDAATTYAAVLKDVRVLYLINGENLDVVEKGLARGTIVRVVSHKDEVFIYDGQGLIQIQLAKEDGSFIHGSKYWIEAEYVQIASPRDIVAKDDGLLPGRIKRENRSELTSMVKDSVFTKGVYYINVNKETPFYINIASTQNCAKYSLASQTGNGYYVIYDDGSFVYDKPGIFVEFPYKQRPRFKLKSENSPETIVRMIVS